MRRVQRQSLSQAWDFDAWADLARRDPDAFEAARRQRLDTKLDALIASAGPVQRQRLRGLQFRLDMERRRATSPLAACLRIQSLMLDSLLGEDGLCAQINGLQQPHRHLRVIATKAARSAGDGAAILPFKPRPAP